MSRAHPDLLHLTTGHFRAYQERRRRLLWQLLGRLPRRRTPSARRLRTRRHRGFTIEELELDLNGLEPVPAYLLLPERQAPTRPGLLYLHAHGGNYRLGKKELLQGLEVLPAYAPVLAELGIVTLAIDAWCFGSRQHEADGHQGESNAFKLHLWQGQVLWGLMIFDDRQALSYLRTRPEVNRRRIGAFGMSMGATRAWWLAALEPRVQVCLDLCCLTDYQELIRTQHLQGHGIYYYVPDLLTHFAAHQINELIVPRPRLSLNGLGDPLTPPAGVQRIADHLRPLYGRFGRDESDCLIELLDAGHEETPAMRALVLDWMQRYLVQEGS